MREKGNYFTIDGLDGTGKTSLISLLKERKEIVTLETPPVKLKRFKNSFETDSLQSRFLYYCLGNLWVDLFQTRKIEDTKIVVQNRSWLSTLGGHEVRGLSGDWLEFGCDLANLCFVPRKSYIIHVDFDERKRRLLNRNLITRCDLDNLKWSEKLEDSYIRWATRLNWNLRIFENNCGLIEAEKRLFKDLTN